jgi:transcriptional regulator with XRE-family HTH domain
MSAKNNIGPKLKIVAQSKGVKISQLAQQIGVPRSSLYTIFDQSVRPTYETVLSISQALDVDLGRLGRIDIGHLAALPSNLIAKELDSIGLSRSDTLNSEIAEHSRRILEDVLSTAFIGIGPNGQRPTIDEMIKWWESTGGRLENLEQVKPLVGIFSVSSADGLEVRAEEVGNQTLVAQSLLTTDPDKIADYFNSLDSQTLEKILLTYVDAYHQGTYKLERRRVPVDVPQRPEKFWLIYYVLLMPVTDAFGGRYVLNYAQFVSYEMTPGSPATKLTFK